jgi:LPS-assembly protein
VTRIDCLVGCALVLGLATPAGAQMLQDRASAPATSGELASATPPSPATDPDQIAFSAATLEYDEKTDIVTASGDVRMFREGQKLRADRVIWNRKTGKVTATGDVAATNPQGDTAYGDSIDLTDSLKGGVVDNMLVVLEHGGRIAAKTGERDENGTVELRSAAYTPCSVTTSAGCPKDPSWKITAVRVTYRPERGRIYYRGAKLHLFGLPGLPLPSLSNPVGGSSSSGILTPQARYGRVNGLEVAVPYFFKLAPNRTITVTPHVFSDALPMLEASYQSLSEVGAFRLTAYGTVSRRSDDLITGAVGSEESFRGYLDGIGRFQLSPEWSVAGSLRVATDKTFLRRYDLSYDDRLRNTIKLERIGTDSYFAIDGWAVQTLRINDSQGSQPLALPEIDYRRRFDDRLLGGRFEVQLNTLALTREEGQDTQRAFAAVRWDLRRLTTLGQEVTLTAYARADAYNTHDTLSTSVASYRGLEGFQGRGIASLSVDVQWPFIGTFLGGTQRLTPRVQLVLSPRIKNLEIPNEDSRAIDLDDTNLFALNRFPGYDRVEDSSRVTYGVNWALDFPGLTVDTQVGQSYRFSAQDPILLPGTGLADNVSDIVGRTEVRFHDLLSLTYRFRLDHDGFAVRKNEIDATIGSRSTYLLLGYLRLNRNITPLFEDLQDREEARVAGRVQVKRFWSAFASAVVDLTDRNEDPLSLADGFDPIRTRIGVTYEDDCLRLGVSWKRDYEDTGDARRGNSYLLTLSFKNLGR